MRQQLRSLILSSIFILAFSAVALAGEVNSPPCAPGEVNSPPCASAPITTDDPLAPGTVNSAPASEVEISITEVAIDLLKEALSVI